MSVASSNVSPARFGAATNRRNSRDLLHKYFSPRHSMSFKPLVDQFATEVKTAAELGRRTVFQSSVTMGWRVGSHFNLYVGMGKTAAPTFSPKVKREGWRLRYLMVD